MHKGEVLPPVPRAIPPPAAPSPNTEKIHETTTALTPFQQKTREVATITAGMGGLVGLGKATGSAFMDSFFTFGLAGLVGYRVVWNVQPALHSPLMSVTNAISGMVGIGGLFVMGGGYFPGTIPQALGALSVLLASINVAGGFIITKRMLDMFKRELASTRTQRQLLTPLLQAQPTLPSIHGCIPSLRSCSLVDSWLLHTQAWPV